MADAPHKGATALASATALAVQHEPIVGLDLLPHGGLAEIGEAVAPYLTAKPPEKQGIVEKAIQRSSQLPGRFHVERLSSGADHPLHEGVAVDQTRETTRGRFQKNDWHHFLEAAQNEEVRRAIEFRHLLPRGANEKADAISQHGMTRS
jgi:hypothetical protein